MSAYGYLDRFTLMGRCVYLEGWASDVNLGLKYDGHEIQLAVVPIDRPDLVCVFGEQSATWGFAAAAVLPVARVDRNLFELRFNDDMIRRNPQDGFSASSDVAFTRMIARFQDLIARHASASLLEIGSRARSGNSYRSWFPTVKDYLGIDIMAGENVDLVCDAHHMSRAITRRFNFVFSIAVFEHILMPWKVALEMNKILDRGGHALIISHAAWPLHEEP